MADWSNLVTAVAAGVVGAVVTLTADSLRWRRQERTRWQPERRELYTRFLLQVRAFADAAAAGDADFDTTPLYDTTEEMDLICSTSTHSAATHTVTAAAKGKFDATIFVFEARRDLAVHSPRRWTRTDVETRQRQLDRQRAKDRHPATD